MIGRSRIEAIVSFFVTVHPHETSAVFYSTSSFFFILSAYFVLLPLRDEGVISLGLGNLPGLFVGSLLLTLVAAPVSTLIFSWPSLPREKGLVLIHRFFSVSLVVFFILWLSSSPGYSLRNFKGLFIVPNIKEELKVAVSQTTPAYSTNWGDHGWFYTSVRIGLFLWVLYRFLLLFLSVVAFVMHEDQNIAPIRNFSILLQVALLNLITISSTWARVIDVMDSESGSRLFGFIGAGATFGQLFGSLFATGMAWMGPYLLLFASLLMELAAQSSKRIKKDIPHLPEELSLMRKADPDQRDVTDEQTALASKGSSPRTTNFAAKPQLWAILDGLRLILSSTYLLYVSLFLWLSAVVSSFFYFQ
ncbi:hypothetical protein RJ639_019990, partial [Escallonia herrerae]